MSAIKQERTLIPRSTEEILLIFNRILDKSKISNKYKI